MTKLYKRHVTSEKLPNVRFDEFLVLKPWRCLNPENIVVCLLPVEEGTKSYHRRPFSVQKTEEIVTKALQVQDSVTGGTTSCAQVKMMALPSF